MNIIRSNGIASMDAILFSWVDPHFGLEFRHGLLDISSIAMAFSGINFFFSPSSPLLYSPVSIFEQHECRIVNSKSTG